MKIYLDLLKIYLYLKIIFSFQENLLNFDQIENINFELKKIKEINPMATMLSRYDNEMFDIADEYK